MDGRFITDGETMLKEVERYYVVGIQRHSIRKYLDLATDQQYILDRTLGTDSPFYEASYKPNDPDRIKELRLWPVYKVQGKQFWGDKVTWGNAEKMLLEQLSKDKCYIRTNVGSCCRV